MFFSRTKDDISPTIRRMIKSVRPPNRKRVLRAMGTTFKSLTEGTFNSAGSDYRPKPWPAKKDGTPSNLQKSTTMAKAFSLEVTDDIARVSNPTKYSRRHQLGDAGGPMPARPFFPVVNGKLTPKAEEMIARAGRRVLDTIASGK